MQTLTQLLGPELTKDEYSQVASEVLRVIRGLRTDHPLDDGGVEPPYVLSVKKARTA